MPPMLTAYSKPPLSIPEQVALLRGRGMSFADETAAREVLSHLSYYRLRGYWIAFEEPGSAGHAFKPGTRFEDVLALYRFDGGVRSRLLHYLSKLEVSLRTQYANCLALQLDPLAYRKEEYFAQGGHWQHSRALEELDQAFQASKERFAVHFRETYSAPPVWAVVEVMSFGQLSRWVRYFSHTEGLASVASAHNIAHINPFVRFVHSAAALRNICAHQNRLVHRILTILPTRPKRIDPVCGSWIGSERRAYNLLTLLAHVMPSFDGDANLGDDLQALSDKHGVSLRVLGFPADWRSRPVWSAAC